MLSALLWFTLGTLAGFILCACLMTAGREDSLKQAWHAGYDYALKREKNND